MCLCAGWLPLGFFPFELLCIFYSSEDFHSLCSYLGHINYTHIIYLYSIYFQEKENRSLQMELQKLIRTDDENRLAINILSDNFDKAQNQCHELIDVVEKLGNENRHLQG